MLTGENTIFLLRFFLCKQCYASYMYILEDYNMKNFQCLGYQGELY